MRDFVNTLARAPLVFLLGLLGFVLAGLVSLIMVLLGVPMPYVTWVNYSIILTVLAVLVIDILFIDSKKRWPGVPLMERLTRVFTFYRD